MERRNSELYVTCYFIKFYRKRTFSKSFNLESLKQRSNFFRQYESIDQIITDMSSKKEIHIEGDEENSNSINVVIKTTLTVNSQVDFDLNLENLSDAERALENEFVINQNESHYRLYGLDQSQILLNKEKEQMYIKSWINPVNKLEAELLYSYYTGEIKMNKNEIELKMPGYALEPVKFHSICDDKNNILIICKSKYEIFGGFTPLCFDSNAGNKSDTKSFLFSLNKYEKYKKNPNKISESIYCNKKCGPSFYDDLSFLENYINIVALKRSNYSTDDNWVDKRNCYIDSDKVLLDKIEIFQIRETNYQSDINRILSFYNTIHNHNQIRNVNNNNNNDIRRSNTYSINHNNIVNNNRNNTVNNSPNNNNIRNNINNNNSNNTTINSGQNNNVNNARSNNINNNQNNNNNRQSNISNNNLNNNNRNNNNNRQNNISNNNNLNNNNRNNSINRQNNISNNNNRNNNNNIHNNNLNDNNINNNININEINNTVVNNNNNNQNRSIRIGENRRGSRIAQENPNEEPTEEGPINLVVSQTSTTSNNLIEEYEENNQKVKEGGLQYILNNDASKRQSKNESHL